MSDFRADDEHLAAPLLGDGRPLLTLGTVGLLFAGTFAWFLAAKGDFLPQDTHFLGMTARELCRHNACSIVHFMIHDRVSFGGTLVAIGVLYLWLIHFPLRDGEHWAWWTLLASLVFGFASFLTYLGYGYLDTWHGAATLLLLPIFTVGLVRAWQTLPARRVVAVSGSTSRQRMGRRLLLGTAFGLMCAGATISVVGMTVVFVPEDLKYMETTPEALNAITPKLIPLIAHDRAGFGGGVFNLGLLVFAIAWFAKPTRHRWQALLLAGVVGFGTAIGVHPVVGYNNPVHLAPAIAGAIGYFIAIALMAGRVKRSAFPDDNVLQPAGYTPELDNPRRK